KGQMVDLEAEMAWLDYQITLRKTINEMARLFFEIQHETRKIEIFRENADIAARMAATAEAGMQSESADRPAVLKAQAEAGEFKKDAQMHAEQKANAVAKALTMLHLPTGSEWGSFQESDLRDENAYLDDILRHAREMKQE